MEGEVSGRFVFWELHGDAEAVARVTDALRRMAGIPAQTTESQTGAIAADTVAWPDGAEPEEDMGTPEDGEGGYDPGGEDPGDEDAGEEDAGEADGGDGEGDGDGDEEGADDGEGDGDEDLDADADGGAEEPPPRRGGRMGRPRAVTEEEVEQWAALRDEEGFTIGEIAAHCGKSKSTVQRYLKARDDALADMAGEYGDEDGDTGGEDEGDGDEEEDGDAGGEEDAADWDPSEDDWEHDGEPSPEDPPEDPETVRTWVEWRNDGVSLKEIARRAGRDLPTIRRHIRAFDAATLAASEQRADAQEETPEEPADGEPADEPAPEPSVPPEIPPPPPPPHIPPPPEVENPDRPQVETGRLDTGGKVKCACGNTELEYVRGCNNGVHWLKLSCPKCGRHAWKRGKDRGALLSGAIAVWSAGWVSK